MKGSSSLPHADSTWDAYVSNHPYATPWHMSSWRGVFEESYGLTAHYLTAEKSPAVMTGLLPLFHFKSPFFGSSLVSMPFLDGGGILADNAETTKELFETAVSLGERLGVSRIELRCSQFPDWTRQVEPASYPFELQQNKVRMLLRLPDSPDDLLASFRSKLRSQIKRPSKEGCIARLGGVELLDEFYGVFSTNMRDLGSPVHSKRLFRAVLSRLAHNARVCIVDLRGKTIAGGIFIWFRDTVCNPWASSLREYSSLSPNMLLYWTMLEFACRNGFSFFDFGRSSPDEGTYRFKEQWGCRAEPLTWLHLFLRGRSGLRAPCSKESFGTLVRYWKKLPLPLAAIAGPVIRKRISL